MHQLVLLGLKYVSAVQFFASNLRLVIHAMTVISLRPVPRWEISILSFDKRKTEGEMHRVGARGYH